MARTVARRKFVDLLGWGRTPSAPGELGGAKWRQGDDWGQAMSEVRAGWQPLDRAAAYRFASVVPLGTLVLTTFSRFGRTAVRWTEEDAYSYAVANVVTVSP